MGPYYCHTNIATNYDLLEPVCECGQPKESHDHVACAECDAKLAVIQTRFRGSHGHMANQFYGGTSTASGYPLWVNTLASAVLFKDEEQARTCLKTRIHDRRPGHEHSVVLLALADETATRLAGADAEAAKR